MNRVILSAGAALLIGFATITSPAMAEKGGGGGRGGGGGGGGGASISHSGGGGGGGGAGISHSAGGGGSGGSVMSHAAPSGGVGGNFSARGNAGTFSGNNSMRMGGMDHGRGRDHDGRFRGPNFALGFYPGYDYNSYDYEYDPDCYQVRKVHTRYGWRLQQVWVCN